MRLGAVAVLTLAQAATGCSSQHTTRLTPADQLACAQNVAVALGFSLNPSGGYYSRASQDYGIASAEVLRITLRNARLVVETPSTSTEVQQAIHQIRERCSR